MSDHLPDEAWFEQLAEETREAGSEDRAPSKLKSRAYSALIRTQQETGPLLNLTQTKAGGRELCIHEEAYRLVTIGERPGELNCCRFCHARVLAEHLDGAPIFWSHCPYVAFQRR